MSGYVDIHNHILPGLDDGPRTMNESIMLARAMVAVGYNTVIATPHTFEGSPAPAQIIERLSELQSELKRLSIPLKLLPGAEQHIEPTTLERLIKGEILTLNQTGYLLLELPMLQPLPVYTEELLFKLVTHNYRPVIPHPERTVDLQRNPKLLYRLYEAGAIFQLTWGAITGWLGPAARQTAWTMLSANLAHLFSTDAHNAASRQLTVNKAATWLEGKQGAGAAELYLSTRPRQLLAGRSLDLPAPSPLSLRAKRKFSFFSRLR